MITKQKIEIYLFYKDVDFFARVGTKEEKDLMSNNDWFLIDNLIYDLNLLRSNKVSSTMKKEIEDRIQECTEGDSRLYEKLFLL